MISRIIQVEVGITSTWITLGFTKIKANVIIIVFLYIDQKNGIHVFLLLH